MKSQSLIVAQIVVGIKFGIMVQVRKKWKKNCKLCIRKRVFYEWMSILPEKKEHMNVSCKNLVRRKQIFF